MPGTHIDEAQAPGRDVIAELAALGPAERARVLAQLSGPQLRALRYAWWRFSHPGQREPEGDWRVWLIRAGRGFGKTRAGAEWVSECARANPGARIALIGGSAQDVAQVMIEGQSGLRAVAHDGERVRFYASKGEVRFASGAVAYAYSAVAGERLRGPEHQFAWADELGKWGRGGGAAWDNLMLGMRLGDLPRVVVTTTPRPNALMRRVMALPGIALTQGRTRDNPHLPRSFVEAMIAEHGGTRLTATMIEGMAVTLDLVPVTAVAASARAASGAVAAADLVHGPTRIVAAELPVFDGGVARVPRIVVAVAGASPGWRAATLMLSNDGGASWGGAVANGVPGVIGIVTAAPGAARATIEDRTGAITVELAHDDMVLAHADAAALDGGANLAMVGDELIQFGSAVQIGARTWALTRLWRGRYGTGHAAAEHAPGEAFVLLDPGGVTMIDLTMAAIGSSVTVGAVGIGDTAPAIARVAVTGASMRPPAPVHGRVRGGVATWVRRSRDGWRWIDGAEVPMVEEAERYRIEVTGADGVVRTAITGEARMPIATGEVARVTQVGDAGPSRVLTIIGEDERWMTT